MKPRFRLTVLLALLAMTVSGCVMESQNPLANHAATAVPGLNMSASVHPATAGGENADSVPVTLYFRYLDTAMLATESRTLAVRRDESAEAAIVRALADGPGAGRGELKRLLPAHTTVESAIARDGILFVTLDGQFLLDDIPADWAEQDAWRSEAPLRRMLTVQSIVATLTEWKSYRGVQILVHRADEVQTNLRLEKQYFLTGEAGVSDPIPRDESYLLTAHNTAQQVLAAWQAHDLESLYGYISAETRPSFALFEASLQDAVTLVSYAITPGATSLDGQTATLTLTLQTMREGLPVAATIYPLQLQRENGIWKMQQAALLALALP